MLLHVHAPAPVARKRVRAKYAWCFGCRARQLHDREWLAYEWYEPHLAWSCRGCRRDRRRFGS